MAYQEMMFGDVPTGRQFTLHGDIWLKTGARTARKVGTDVKRHVGKFAGVLVSR